MSALATMKLAEITRGGGGGGGGGGGWITQEGTVLKCNSNLTLSLNVHVTFYSLIRPFGNPSAFCSTKKDVT